MILKGWGKTWGATFHVKLPYVYLTETASVSQEVCHRNSGL